MTAQAVTESPVRYMERTRLYYRALGYENDYVWAQHDEVPFTPLRKPLSAMTVGLVSTAGPGDRSHRDERNRRQVWSGLVESPPASFDTDVAWDKESTHTEDRESFLPLDAAQHFVATGRLGALAPRFHAAPTEYSQKKTIEQDAPEILRRLREDGAEAAILSALCPVCHQTESLVARHLEANGMPTVLIGSARDIVEHCGVPRFVFSDFPLGNPCGHPWNQEMQRAILGLALDLLESATGPRSTVQSPFAWKPEDPAWRERYARVRPEDRERLLATGDERRRRFGQPPRPTLRKAVEYVPERPMTAPATAHQIAYARLFRQGTPAPAPRFTGFPKYNFVGGHNDPAQIPVAALADAAATALRREGADLALYNLGQGPLGHKGLRNLVADKLKRHRGVACTGDDVLITSGSLQGLDLVNELLLEPGDTVLVEELSFQGAISRLRKRAVTIVPVPLDDEGLRMDALSDTLDGLQARGVTPKYLYTIPTIQNPTGSILPLERRQQLLALARAHGMPVFEDECYADLIWAGTGEVPPALYALDPAQVIHIGSFSKTLAPALRSAYAVAPWEALSRLVALKADGGTGAVEQMLVAEYFSSHFDTHVASLSSLLEEKLRVMLEAVEREFGAAAECFVPKGGIFLWLRLPAQVDVRKLVKPAAERGIQFNPGPEWAVDAETAKSQLRLCFALPSIDEIREGVAALARVCFEQTGIPAQSGNLRNA